MLLQAAVRLACASEDNAVKFSVLNHPDFSSASGSVTGSVVNDGVLLMLASLGLRGQSYMDLIARVSATNTEGHNIPESIIAILNTIQLPSRATHCFEKGRAQLLQIWEPVTALDAIRAALSGSHYVTVVARGQSPSVRTVLEAFPA